MENFENTLTARSLYDPSDIQSSILVAALEAVQFNRFTKAIEKLERVLIYDQNNVDVKFWLGICYYHGLSNLDNAGCFFTEALCINPSRADCLSQLAYINWDKMNYEESLVLIKKAIEVEPDWPLLRLEHIYLLYTLNKVEEAKSELFRSYTLLEQPIDIPNNAVDRYFAQYVTGKNWNDFKNRLYKLQILIFSKQVA